MNSNQNTEGENFTESFTSFGKNPMEILEILETVLKHVDSEDVLEYRSVCKLWDETVVRIITTVPARGFYLCCGESTSQTAGSWSYFKTRRLKMDPQALEELKILLKESKRPQLLFKNVSLSSFIPEIQNMLMKYGKCVKNLELELKDENNTFHVLNKCLGQNGYCPNVQVLKVVSCTYQNQVLPLDQVENLKLKNLTLKDVANCEKMFCKGVSGVLAGILLNSTEINSIKIKNTKHVHMSQTTRYCVEHLQKAPHIAKNLKALHIKGDVYENLEALCKIKFSKNLKIVKLAQAFNVTEMEISNDKKQEGLRKFAKLVGDSLEAFQVDDDQDERHDDLFLLDVSDLPLMPRLKMTSYMTWKNASGDFLSNFPVLRMLRLDEIKNLQIFLEKFVEKKYPVCLTPGSLNYVPKLVHKHVATIEVLYNEINVLSPMTIQIMNAVFPNIRYIFLELKFPDCSEYWVEGQEILIERFFQAITEMKNLTKLSIGFTDWKYNELFGVLDLTQAFSNLKASPSLRILCFTSFDAENPNYTFLVPHLLALIGAPKLDQIRLCRFPMAKENKKMHREVKNKLDLNGIYLYFGPGSCR